MKSFVKAAARGVACLLVLPAVAVYRMGALVAGRDRAFPGWSQLFALLPGMTGDYLRHAFYSMTLDRCADGTCITFGTIFSHPGASLGKNVYVGTYCSLGAVTLEDDVLVASNVSIMNGSHQHGTRRLDIPIREQPGVFEEVKIGTGSWIGERTTVAASVGKHCIIGAGALVTKPVPDYAIAVGVPAKPVGFRNAEAEVDHRPENTEQLVTSISRNPLPRTG
jgi:virginiamycin A acetyltransferase